MDPLSNGLINKWRLLLHFYKQIGITDEELILILLIMHFSTADNRFITPDILHNYSHFSTKKIDAILNSLKTKNLLMLVKNPSGGMEMNFSALFNRLLASMNKSMLHEIDELKLIKCLQTFLDQPLKAEEQEILVQLVASQVPVSYLNSYFKKSNQHWTYQTLVLELKKILKTVPKELTQFNWADA